MARSRTLRASRSGWNAKSNSSRVLWWGQPGQFERGLEAASFALAELFTEEQVDEVAVAHGVSLSAGDEVFEVLGKVWEPESGGVVADPGGDQLTHAAPTSVDSEGWPGVDGGVAGAGQSPARTS